MIFNDWKLSVTGLIFCHETNLVYRTSFFSYIRWWRRCAVCTLSLSHIKEVKCPAEEIVTNHMEFLHNTRLTKHDVSFPFILTISFVNLIQSAKVPTDFILLTKKIFKETPHINVIIHHTLIWFCRPKTDVNTRVTSFLSETG